jgi:hypothetical protein
VDVTVFELHNAGNTEAQQKAGLAYLLAQVSTGKAAMGVLSGLVVSQTATASGSVQVAAGGAVAQAAVLDGASLLVNDSTATIDVFTANPMGSLPRNDIIVFDAATLSLRVIVGAPNATPTDPTVPTSAVKLARLRNAASATTIPTSAIDDLRVYTSLAGATITVASAAQRDLLPAVNGMTVYRADTKVKETYNGGVWRASVFARASGTWTPPNQATGNTSTQHVTFPAGLFTSVPVVNATAGSTRLNVAAVNIDVNGFDLQSSNWTSAASTGAPISWIAEQATG